MIGGAGGGSVFFEATLHSNGAESCGLNGVPCIQIREGGS